MRCERVGVVLASAKRLSWFGGVRSTKPSPHRNLRAVISLRASTRRFSCGSDDGVRAPCFVGRSPRPRSLKAWGGQRLEEAGGAEKVVMAARGDLGVYVFVAPPPRRVDLGDAAVCGRRRGESGIAKTHEHEEPLHSHFGEFSPPPLLSFSLSDSPSPP